MDKLKICKTIFDIVGYNPNPAQWKIHLDNTRHKIMGGGERGGKSITNEKYF